MRHTELAHHQHVQRRVEGRGHLERHRDTAARQGQHQHVAVAIGLQRPGQPPTRVGPISEAPQAGAHWSHGILQSPFCHNCSGLPPVLRTSTTSPGTEKL